jgi:hypothetical protein
MATDRFALPFTASKSSSAYEEFKPHYVLGMGKQTIFINLRGISSKYPKEDNDRNAAPHEV